MEGREGSERVRELSKPGCKPCGDGRGWGWGVWALEALQKWGVGRMWGLCAIFVPLQRG